MMVDALDLSTVESKVFTCTDFEIHERDTVDSLLATVYECMQDTRVFQVAQNTIDDYLRQPMSEFASANRAHKGLQQDAARHEANSRRELRNIQRGIVSIRMDLKYLVGESHLPPLTQLSDATNMRNVNEYLKQNAKYIEYMKAIPLQAYMFRVQNITSFSHRLESAQAARESRRAALQKAVADFRHEITSHYRSYVVH
tara:strand:- start:1147 stop:1743 length:597 start_codon:yes stop_codon:yes gene_type:complete